MDDMVMMIGSTQRCAIARRGSFMLKNQLRKIKYIIILYILEIDFIASMNILAACVL